MAYSQTDFPAISVNDETSVSLAFHYARPRSRRRRGRWRRLYNWRRRWGRSLLFLLFNDRSRSCLFNLRTRGRATYVGRSDAPHNRSWRRARRRARNDRTRSRARDNRGRSRTRNHRSRGRARDDRSRGRARNDRTRSRTLRAYCAWITIVIVIREHAGIESGERDNKRRQRN